MKTPMHQGWCHQCGSEFLFEIIHSGFNEVGYAYCRDCGTAALLDTGCEERAGLPRHRAITEEGEALLSACPCGGSFGAQAAPRCPHCLGVLDATEAAEYIEAAIRKVAGGWSWQRNWHGLYCMIVERRVVHNNLIGR